MLEAFGADVVLVETVGVGQDEVDVAHIADTTVVIGVPGLGDEVQVLKAGLLEVADILVVNKADRPNADRVIGELRMLQTLVATQSWPVPVLQTVAIRAEGVEELVGVLEAHREYLCQSGRWRLRKEARGRYRVLGIVEERLMRRAERALADEPWMQRLERVARREEDPYTLAEDLLSYLSGH